MDFDDLLDDAPIKPALRVCRFQPKSAKLKHKPETPKPENFSKLIPKQEDVKPIERDDTMIDAAEEDSNMEATGEDETMADEIVRTIDVYFTPPPIDSNGQLYVLQYPLRPSWRPYELDETCKEVRIQPQSGKVQVELSLDTSTNYDEDIADTLRIEKQVLSSWRPPLTTSYAVGVLRGNELHLNPVHAVVQLHKLSKVHLRNRERW
ncbi:hypothetical protein ACHQM5_014009 [Ranunculus cassubicifolius]